MKTMILAAVAAFLGIGAAYAQAYRLATRGLTMARKLRPKVSPT